MTSQQAKHAFNIAINYNINLSHIDDSHLFGFALPCFKPTYTTLQAVAKLIRWQALQFNGTCNHSALNEIISFGRKRFIIID